MNKIVHIALVGGQTMPIYMCLRESKAEKVILIHSSSTKWRAEKIQSDLMPECPQRSFELIDLDPLDYEVIKKECLLYMTPIRNGMWKLILQAEQSLGQ